MTDRELEALFRKHVAPGKYLPDPKHEFLGTAFYDFARELEHHALAAGMLATTRSEPPIERGRRAAVATGMWGLIGWLVGR